MPCAESKESEHKKAGAVGLLLLIFFNPAAWFESLISSLSVNSAMIPFSSTVANIALWLFIVSVHLTSGYIFPSLFVIIAIFGESSFANFHEVEP